MNKDFTHHDLCYMQARCSQPETCPMVIVHKLFSGKWKILILWYLSSGCLRFSELHRRLPDVTQKILTMQLRSLETDGLIYRKIYPVIPPKVEYGLTEIGLKILPLLEGMFSYGVDYMDYKSEQ